VVYAVFAATGVILAAVYMLWMFQRVMFGEVTNPKNENLPDMTKREIAVLLPVVVLIIWIGVYPKPFLKPMEATVNGLIQRVEQRVDIRSTAVQSTLEMKSSKKLDKEGELGRQG
jgi:NADH-quinone oxidoreductase subunit M